MPITVTEDGRASAPTDQALLDLQVQVLRTSAAEALDALSAAVAVVLDVLAGGPTLEHATTDVGLGADHDRDGHLRGHRATQSLTAVVPVARAGGVLADVVGASGDAVTVRSLAQRVGDHDDLRRRARADAVARARAAARQHAELVGRDLGALVDLVEGRPLAAPAPAMRAMASLEAHPVAGGSHEAVITVTATWDLLPTS